MIVGAIVGVIAGAATGNALIGIVVAVGWFFLAVVMTPRESY
jgi:hypothetical protein